MQRGEARERRRERRGQGVAPALRPLSALLASLLLGGAAAAAGPSLRSLDASSIQRVDAKPTDLSQDQGRRIYRPRHLIDQRRWSTWCAARSESRGEGQVLRFELDRLHYLGRVAVINGDIRGPKEFRSSIRTRRLRVRTASGEQDFDLREGEVEPQVLDLASAQPSAWVELEITEVYPSGEQGPCFSEVWLYELERPLTDVPGLQARADGALAGLTDPERRAAARADLLAIGPPAAALLRDLLGHGDPATRLEAAHLLAQLPDPSGAEALVGALAKASAPAERAALVDALAALGAPAQLDRLRRLSSDPESAVAEAALRGLAKLGSPPALDSVVKAALSDDPRRAGLAASLLPTFGKRALAALQPALDHKGRRERALRALAQFDLPEARKEFERRWEGADPPARAAALEGLANTGRDDALARLLEHAEDPAEVLRSAVARGLPAFGPRPAVLLALSGLLRDPNDSVRAAGRSALTAQPELAAAVLPHAIGRAQGSALEELQTMAAALPTEAAAQVQAGLLADPRRSLREGAEAWFAAQGEHGLPWLLRASAAGDPAVRTAALGLLARGDEAGRQALLGLATAAPEPELRATCLRTLGRLQVDQSRGCIRDGLRAEETVVQAAALEAAQQVPWRGYEEPLRKILAAGLPALRADVLRAIAAARITELVPDLLAQLTQGQGPHEDLLLTLGRLGDVRALPALLDALRGRSAEQRSVAVRALAGIHDERALAALMEAMVDPEPRVREAAERALARGSVD